MTDPVSGVEETLPLQRPSERLRQSWLFHPRTVIERVRELRRVRRAPAPLQPHLVEALAWLERAQDTDPDGGFSRAYGMTWIPYMRCRGWQPSYPETTGYIVPTLIEASHRTSVAQLADRAVRAARWLLRHQMGSGAIPGGTVAEVPAPAAFNTGQVVFGWLAAYAHTGDTVFAEAVARACRYLATTLDQRGLWPAATAPFALGDSTLYNARTGWALAEAGIRLGMPDCVDAARRHLKTVAMHQHTNGWFPDCCLSNPERPLLHTLAYATRGLIEGGRVLGDPELVRAGARAADAVRSRVGGDGWIPGRLRRDWSAAVSWSCLTGQAQMANVWIRLAAITGDEAWLEPVPRVLDFLLRRHDVDSENPGLRGGVRGSWPVNGGYAAYEVLSWGTKFLCDVLMRWDDVRQKTSYDPESALALA